MRRFLLPLAVLAGPLLLSPGLAACAREHSAPRPVYSEAESNLVMRDLEGAWRGEAIVRDTPETPARRELISLTMRPRPEGGLLVTADTTEGTRGARIGYLYRDGAMVSELRPGIEEVTRITEFVGAERRWRLQGEIETAGGEMRVRQALSGPRFRRLVEYKAPGAHDYVVMYAASFTRVEAQAAAPQDHADASASH